AIVAWARKFRGVIKWSITSGCSMTGLASEQGTTNPREGTTGVDFEARSNMREKTRYHTIAGTLVAWVIACAMSYSPPVQAQSGVPKYEVDPFWAKLPDSWVVGPLGGTCIDTRDHVFVLHRQEGLT